MVDDATADWLYGFCQKCISANPVLVIGSGASAAYSLPTMAQLSDYLIAGIEKDGVPEGANEQWEIFKSSIADRGLEQAIDDASIWRHELLYQRLRALTWHCIVQQDMLNYDLAVSDGDHLALAGLFKHLLSSHHNKLSVVTTNYDRLPEYAADSAGMCTWTGFFGNYQGRWIGFNSPLEFWQGNKKVSQNTIEVLKVHGSLDWFVGPSRQPLCLRGIDKIPPDHSAIIVPPSLRKTNEVLNLPLRDVLQRTDNILENADSFLCIGYGFNDEHIQLKLIERARYKKVPVVLLSKKITNRVVEIFLKENDGIQFLILEEGDGASTRFYSHLNRDGDIVEGENLWDLRHFVKKVVGYN